jgi:hypothetical protein
MTKMLVAASMTVVAMLMAGCSGGGGSEGDATVPEDYPYPVVTPERVEARTHLQIGEVFDGYTSDPPTSGPTRVPAGRVSRPWCWPKRCRCTTWSTRA